MPGGDPKLTLEITVAPTDLPHARHILPHQLRVWGDQVDEVQFTFDLHTSRGRFGAAAEERRPGMEALLRSLCEQYPHAHVRPVDYAPEAVADVGRRFFGGATPPPKNHYGGAFYAYFFGPHTAKHDHILHVDSDMLFGGASRTWSREALALMQERPEVVLASPHPGPPTDDGSFPPEVSARHADPRPDPVLPRALSFASFSTRVYLMDRKRFVDVLCPLDVEHARPRSRARAFLEGHPPYAIPEDILTAQMARRGVRRLDLLGEPPGMWSLHPAMRSDEFYEGLPDLVSRVEAGDMPPGQLGDYDVNDSLVDWTSARAALRRQTWWRRMPRTVAARMRG